MRRAPAGMGLFVLVACLVASAPEAASWTVSVGDREGLPVATRSGVGALRSRFVFWGKDWSWAGQQTEFKVVAPFEYAIVGSNRALGLALAGRIHRPSSRQLVWELDLDARGDLADVIGGGISFRFDLATFSPDMGEPELLAANRGWAWGRAAERRMEMRFEPPLAAVYFERGSKSEIRAFFYKGAVSRGTRRQVATLSVSGDIAIGPTRQERYGLDDPARWPGDILDWSASPVDLSFLNASEKPAGKHGFLKVRKDALAFEDGTPARFWGTNLTSYALFRTDREQARKQARRLSELGFNLVRLHHHDSPWVNPNLFGDRSAPSTQNLDPAMLEKLDWWIKCLKDEGIYVWLDLHVQRSFKPGDRIDGFEELVKGNRAELKGYNYVNPSIVRAMTRFNEAYVNRENSFTGARYRDEPAIVAMLITNENDLTYHFGNALLPDKNVPKHNARYMAEAEAFAAKYKLAKDKVWRSWEHGPAKLFLNDLERRFNVDMISHLRAQGVRVPLVTTSAWGVNPLSSLPALTAGDIIDVHAYGSVGELERNPLYGANLVHWIARAQIAGKPLSVTEWNVEDFPAPDRHVIPLYVAASARLQGWDALMQYAYAQVPLHGPSRASNWHAYNDPALIAALPAAALLYRRGDVRGARTVYAFAPSKRQLFDESISPRNSVALRTAAEKGRLVIALPRTAELPWLEESPIPHGATVITDPQQAVIARDATGAVSDTGELRRDWSRGVFTIDTPRSQAAMGWIGGETIRLADIEIAVLTPSATVAVQSLDDRSIDKSGAIMISLGARSVPASGDQLPFRSEPVQGRLFIRAAKGLTLYAQRGSAQGRSPPTYAEPGTAARAREVPVTYANGRYRIELEAGLGTYWLVLK